MSIHATRRIGLYAVGAAAASLLLAPLLALAYFATADGAAQLGIGTVSTWAQPARTLAGDLLTFADADRVYASYTQAYVLVFPAIVLTAFAARSQRPTSVTRVERWGWRLLLTGYSVLGLGLAAFAILLIPTNAPTSAANLVFVAAMMPRLLLSLIGSTVLGVAFLRSGYQPKVTAWLGAVLSAVDRRRLRPRP
jgi:hypothetical protein